jgi:hypothetical protein
MDNQSKMGCFTIGIIAVIIFGIIGSCSGGHSDSDSIVPAHEAVQQNLKSPSTADFVDDDVVTKTDDGYKVTGSVDAENGFGATVRVDYEVTEDKDNNVTDVRAQNRE